MRRFFAGPWDIRRKLLVAFSLLAMLPALTLTMFSYAIATNALEHKVREYSHDILYQTTITLQDRLQKIEEISFNVAIDSDVQTALDGAVWADSNDLERSRMETRVQSILASQVLFHDEVNGIFLESNGGQRFELDKYLRGTGLETDPAGDLSAAAGGSVWFGGTEASGVVTLGRQINSIRTQRPLGQMLLDVPEDFLREVTADTQIVLGGSIMVVDADGRVVSSADKSTLGQPSSVPQDQITSSAYTFQTITIDGAWQYVAASEPLDNGWRVVAVIPVEVYRAEINELRNVLLLIGAAIVLIAVGTAVGVAGNLSRPIQQLSSDMKTFGDGDLTMRSGVERGDEIGELARTFNTMADNIDELVARVYKEQSTKREIEVRSLRMQINPHFLYNTLETINWAARKEGADDAGVMAKSLGDLLRATIDAKDMVPLSDEVEKLRHYVQIQGYRYGDRLSVAFDVDSQAVSLLVPTLILQPLVENAIVHGIEPSMGPGTVTIRTRREEDCVVLSVGDDGVGMPPEMVSVLERGTEASSPSSSKDSIGLANVIRRIHASFPDRALLTISSELGEGTTITLTLPIIETEQKEEA